MHAFSLGRRSPPTAPSSSEASSSIVDALGASEEARLAHKGANVAASIADELRRLSPDGEFLQRGHEFVADEPTQLLRWVGEPSFCRLVGLRLGAPDAGPAWDHFAEDPRLLEAIGQDILQLVPTTAERNALVRASLLTVGSRRLLNPSNARGWGLLRAVARSLYEAATATDPERTASENYTEQMGRCWAWDTHAMEHQYEKPWIVLMLLGKLALAGEADKTFEPAHGTVCAVSMRDWLEDTTLVFYSLHPCMHYLSDGPARTLYERAKAGVGSWRCPTCKTPILFLREVTR